MRSQQLVSTFNIIYTWSQSQSTHLMLKPTIVRLTLKWCFIILLSS